MYFAPTFLATLLVSVNALATPHIGNDIHRRHQALVKVRAAAPEPVPPPVVASAGISNARLRKRCKPRPSNSSVASTPSPVAFSAVSSSAVSSTASPAPNAPPPVNVAPDPKPLPATSSSAPPAPSPSPTPTHSSAPAPSPAPPPSQSPSSGGSQSGSLYSGTETGADITFYGAGLGACGIVNSDSDFIAAVSELLFDNAPGYNRVNPNTNPLCNKKVSIEYQGKQVTVTITDRCVACKVTDLDLTPTAFSVLGDQSIGRLHGATWNWLT